MPREKRQPTADGAEETSSAPPEARQEEAAPAAPDPDEAAPGKPARDEAQDGAAGEAHAVKRDIDELLTKARERDEYLSLAQRTQADFENYRKRAAKEIAAAEGRGVAKLARELLPALDNLALALAAVEGEDGHGEPSETERRLAEGIRLVSSEIQAALARVGIEPYSPQGERFDPELHEAMAQQPVEGAKPGTVVEVYQRGYRLNGSVLRPARVVVAE